MSYVLDALRKSEHERQRASGQTASILYPVTIEQNRMVWLWSAMLAGVVIAVIVFVSIWWIWPHSPATIPSGTGEKADVSASLSPQAVQALKSPVQEPKPAISKPAATTAPVAKRIPVTLAKKGSPSAGTSGQPAQPVAPPDDKTEASDDPLKGLPPLVISGYMHDEQVGSVAIINDKLVHEGEEVAPELRLEKILGDGALFNYKGYQFRR